MTQNTPDKSEVEKWKLKIGKDIKEEDMYIMMIDNELRHNVGINESEKSLRDLKEEIIKEVEKIMIFLVQSTKTQQIQNATPQYQQ